MLRGRRRRSKEGPSVQALEGEASGRQLAGGQASGWGGVRGFR